MNPIDAVLGAATRPAQAAADLVASAWRVVGRVDAALERVEGLIDDVAATNAHAQAVVDRIDATSRQAAEAVDLGSAELRRATDRLSVEHVDAVAHLLELVPELLDLVVPALRGMADLTPELDRLTDRFDTVGQIVEGLPGAKRLRRRGEEREVDAADAADAEQPADGPD